MGSLIKNFWLSTWGKTLCMVIMWNVGVRVVAAVGYFLLPARFAPLDFIAPIWQSNFLWWSLANFDGEHYLSIAEFGYQIRNAFPQYAFFPLVPVLIRALSYLTQDLYLAGILVSQGSLWVALTYIYKWCQTLRIKDMRLPLLLAPGAVFLASIYTEPTFIALAALTMYYSEKQWWGKAVIVTALATATRVNGLILAVFLFIKLIKAGVTWPRVVGYLLLSFVGIGAYMLYLGQETGDMFAWYHAQSAWGKSTATSPLTTLISYVRALSVDFVADLTHLVVAIEVMVTLGAIGLFIKLLSLQRLDLSYWVYLLLSLALPIGTGSLGSMPRFALLLFPLLAVAPDLSVRGKALYYSLSISCAMIGILLFTRGYWYG